jgi:hypothetical protein
MTMLARRRICQKLLTTISLQELTQHKEIQREAFYYLAIAHYKLEHYDEV